MGESSEEPISGGTPAVEFAGFWRRLGALLIDSIILGVAGWIIATVFYEKLIEYGPNGRIIGLPIALLYFAFLNSGLAGGGTPGKRVLGIRVVTRDGGTIAIWRSLGRAFVLEVPFAANGMDFSFLNISSGSMTWVFAIEMHSWYSASF
ncbi:MAG TPA: RDD family protein [Rhizomicrobium sp.]|jgi:uncharacterized RDD family membrane protein YckC|nr:RDD family protein [Rhizomicrobium sp.]